MKKSGADIVVADCGLGNLHSVAAALGRVSPGADIRVSRDPAEVENAAKVVLPGDGHFDACAREIRARGMESALRRAAREKPFFGVCVGMQILYESSDEGDEKGLGIFPGRIRRIPSGGGRKIPHMGWNEIRPRRPHPILAGMENGKGGATAEGTGEGGGGGRRGGGSGSAILFHSQFLRAAGFGVGCDGGVRLGDDGGGGVGAAGGVAVSSGKKRPAWAANAGEFRPSRIRAGGVTGFLGRACA